MRILVATAVCLAMVGLSAGAEVEASIKKSTNIPAQELVPALKALAKERGLQVVFQSEVVGSTRTQGAFGELTTAEALEHVLSGTGLTYRYLDDKTITIVPTQAGADLTPSQNGATAAADSTGAGPEEISKQPFLHRLRLAQSAQATGSASGQNNEEPSARNAETGRSVEEIVVTAQKREERLQDVPVPVTAVSAAALVDSHQLRIQDYYTRIPGLNLALVGPEAGPTVAIRGLTMSGSTNPTVGIVIDEVSYGSTVTIGNTLTIADVDPGDLARVEVLRGPQGTLYGAASIGGLLKFATIDPSTDAVRGRIQAGMIRVENGDDLGYSVRGAVNVPLGDTFAVRASGFTTHDPGYIDNVVSGDRGVNRGQNDGGRLAALWQPAESFSLKLSAMIQEIDRDGSADVTVAPGLGDLQQNQMPGTGGYGRDTQAYSATLRARLGSAELTSATGYSVDKTTSLQDVTPSFFSGRAVATFGVAGAADYFVRTVDKLTQEIRLSIPAGDRLEWLFGAFYTNEKTDVVADYWAFVADTGAPVGRLVSIHTPDNRFEEYAAFADLTVRFTPRFDVQFGARMSENKQSFYSIRTGPLVPFFFGVSSPSVLPTSSGKDSPFTYLVTPRLKVSPDLMVYARLASGYRPGAPNVNCGLVPCESSADTTQNYEVGVKGSMLDRLLTFDASLYYIDWKDIQLNVSAGSLGYVTNAGRAKSRGVELSVESRPLAGLALAAWVAWNDAQLTEDFPPTSSAIGHAGDRLPFGSRFSGHVSVDREFGLSASVTGFVGGSLSYVGDRKGIFGGAIRQEFPAYTQVDLRAGARFDTWTIDAFVNNVGDKRALLGGGIGNFIPTAFNYNQPRTVGLAISKAF